VGNENDTQTQAGQDDTSSGVKNAIDWSSVNWSQVEVPEEVITSHKTYKSVLTESIDRRKEISTLKGQLEELTVKPSEIQGTDSDDPMVKTLSALTKTIEGLQARLDNQDREVMRENIARKHSLPIDDKDGSNYLQLIQGVTEEEMERSATALASLIKPTNSQQPPSSKSPGNSGTHDPEASLRRRVSDRLTGKADAVSPFDPGVHRQKGGGIHKG